MGIHFRGIFPIALPFSPPPKVLVEPRTASANVHLNVPFQILPWLSTLSWKVICKEMKITADDLVEREEHVHVQVDASNASNANM